jgi:hypothetical protein
MSRGAVRPAFELQATVHRNVEELRRYLGSATRPLSFAALAEILNEKDERRRSRSSVKRWEDGAEPDYASAKLMAQFAGVTFEEFCLGARATLSHDAVPIVDRDVDEVLAPPAPPVRHSGTRQTGR